MQALSEDEAARCGEYGTVVQARDGGVGFSVEFVYPQSESQRYEYRFMGSYVAAVLEQVGEQATKRPLPNTQTGQLYLYSDSG